MFHAAHSQLLLVQTHTCQKDLLAVTCRSSTAGPSTALLAKNTFHKRFSNSSCCHTLLTLVRSIRGKFKLCSTAMTAYIVIWYKISKYLGTQMLVASANSCACTMLYKLMPPRWSMCSVPLRGSRSGWTAGCTHHKGICKSVCYVACQEADMKPNACQDDCVVFVKFKGHSPCGPNMHARPPY